VRSFNGDPLAFGPYHAPTLATITGPPPLGAGKRAFDFPILAAIRNRDATSPDYNFGAINEIPIDAMIVGNTFYNNTGTATSSAIACWQGCRLGTGRTSNNIFLINGVGGFGAIETAVSRTVSLQLYLSGGRKPWY